MTAIIDCTNVAACDSSQVGADRCRRYTASAIHCKEPPVTETPQPKNPERLELEALTSLQPGFARLMPEIGARMWKAYHAGRAQNWALASWQLKEMRKLFRLGNVTRPKYEANVEAFIDEDLAPLFAACEAADLAAFEHAFHEAVEAANDSHRRWNKGFLVWKVPQAPPEDLVLEPQP